MNEILRYENEGIQFYGVKILQFKSLSTILLHNGLDNLLYWHTQLCMDTE